MSHAKQILDVRCDNQNYIRYETGHMVSGNENVQRCDNKNYISMKLFTYWEWLLL